jgi:hypothetical protein
MVRPVKPGLFMVVGGVRPPEQIMAELPDDNAPNPSYRFYM